ncbi:hypothetical protein NCLIV_022260 [Neospora caninum Liverpool]|uniref:Vacuolar import and degradation protein 27 n=1 Tax=Neospora caninum (strain Liverpool) TaxID=572307 RepID=F0VFE3_NEOCL|nr:hypothetical protein NCLIV_022260 [Neospora caninum Liverpool]CBZ52437.1 hypothetical protein NCLIV_022260 [Neospora caninum Liverpool]CEL66411.1 TPA: Vacuolar import and degradation protein 27 [Neospora caninum Liverpool]|eukprot:XP_003882469.1 hypothetical protein NCLIV_022260 [Neospora caninum Liverpool]
MLSGLISGLWRSSAGSADEVRTTVGSPRRPLSGSSDLANARVSLYLVRGAHATELFVSASLAFENDGERVLVIRGVSEEGRESEERFPCPLIRRVRHHQSDMFQWMVVSGKSKGDDVGDEYGLLFERDEYAWLFERVLIQNLCAEADELLAIEGSLSAYRRLEKKWELLSDRVACRLVQRPHTLEGFLLIRDAQPQESPEKSKSDGGAPTSEDATQWQLSLSYDEFITMDSQKKQIQWWGPGALCAEGEEDEGGGERQLFELRLQEAEVGTKRGDSGDDRSHQFFLLIQKVMMEAAEGARVDDAALQTVQAMEASFGYESDAFDRTVKAREEDFEVEWDDAQSEEATDEETEASLPLVQRDPTRDVWAKCPDAMLYKQMNVGKDRTFVFRQTGQASRHRKNDVQVLAFDEFGKTRTVATLDDSKFDFKKHHVNPATALLHDGERKMILVDEGRENVYMMDVEREQIVQTWDANHMSIGGVMPSRKDGNQSHDRTFVAYNPQAIFCMDTREAARARTHTISYASKVNFTCGATDADGHIATGNAVGDIRLYDGGVNTEGKYKRAKTHLKGLGDPLLHVCALRDGSWVLGTCQKYLILFPVKLSSSGKTGFVTALGQQKPPPIVLRLRLEDIAFYNLQELSFTKAEFDDDESTIVTSTNNLVIIWDFVAVKRGDLFAYSIRKVHEYIKDVAFAKACAGDGRVIMATPSNVNTKPLKKIVR